MAQNIQERFKELQKLIGEQESRIQNLQSSSFQLANYYFVFQGVILAAISNTTSLTCKDAWYIFTLSLLAATLNIFALFSIGTKYIRAMNLHDQTWSEYNSVASLVSARNQNRAEPLEFGNDDNRNQRDSFSQRRRYVVLAACMFLFLAFAGVTLSGPRRVTCKHDEQRNQSCSDTNCLKLCHGSKCMIFCHNNS
ncbi:hypothetical protein CDL12_13798 [Handroanthus impetiginosus]|uniref:Transmembrane protein n=1 Tax=Handroanthus impetiginosus TaxID=429701 RepID=A0A2G9H7V3_9LAMI|nr:hypothetical protein CDL12_13798 [Handroanthus impetiginosus]